MPSTGTFIVKRERLDWLLVLAPHSIEWFLLATRPTMHSGYFEKTTFMDDAKATKGDINFYDSNTGKLLFTAPKGRTLEEFLVESRRHGWPSFRDDEVNWDYVRVLPDGECVSVDGTHLGHNLPDGRNRYCINLVSVGKCKRVFGQHGLPILQLSQF